MRREINSSLEQSGSGGAGEKWMDLRESVWKCISTLGDVLGVGGKGKEAVRMTHQFLAHANWVDGDNLY